MKYLLPFVLLIIITSCGGRDASVPMPQINGTWRLASLDTEVAKTPLAENNVQLWTFDDYDAEITVVNKAPDGIHALLPEGS